MNCPAKIKRPVVTLGETSRIQTGCGWLYLVINELPAGEVIELFPYMGKKGGCVSCQLEAITRCIAIGLRHGIPISEYVEEIEKLHCPSPSIDDGREVKSCPDAIATLIKEFIARKEILANAGKVTV